VRLEYDPEARRVAALTLGVTLALVATAIMFVLSWFKPAGQVGNSKILADRDTGAIYVMVDGRLHPALNLMSARLIAGQAVNPTFVKAAEIQKYPQGPTVGIPGAPTAMPVRAGGAGQWAVCDSAPTATAMTSAGDRPLVTAIAGPLSGAGAGTLQMPSAVLTRHNGKTYILWDGRRSEVDLNNKAVALALGIDPGSPAPVPMSKALFDAIPATDPLVLPAIPDAGKPAPWNLGPGVVIGSVLSVRDLTEQAAVLVNPRPPSYPGNRLNFPSKVLEYLSTGKPVVTTRTLSLAPEYDNVLLFAGDDTAAGLAAAIDGVLDWTSDERSDYRRKVSQFAAEHGDWQVVTGRFLGWASGLMHARHSPQNASCPSC
jgi:hypothetical protein